MLDDILKLSEKESDDASIEAVGFTPWVFVLQSSVGYSWAGHRFFLL